MSRRALISLLLLIAAAVGASAQVVITSTSPLPTGYTGIFYDYTLKAAATNTTMPLTWTVVTGSTPGLPPGITLSSNGTLSGTTSLAGNYEFQVMVTSGGFSNQMTFSLPIQTSFVTINTPSPLPNGFVGQPYSLLLSSSSAPAGDLWSSPAMPPGLSLSPQGLISGNPTTAGQYSVSVTSEIGGTNISTTQALSLTIYTGQVAIQTASLPEALSGQPYSTTLVGSPVGATYALSGNLPLGITFNSNTGAFSGSSTMIGTYAIQVQGNYPNYLSTTRTYNLYVVSGPLAVTQTSLPPAVQGSPYTTTVGATGGLPPYQWSFGTTSTNGLSINPTNGTITGTPLANGNFVFRVNLTDAAGLTVPVGLTLFVADPLSVLTSTLANGTVGTAYSQSLVTMGGIPLFTWTLAAGGGPLPPGLSLSSGGVISGTPTANGTFPFSVQVTDSGGRTATQALTISVGVATLSITTTALPNGQISAPYSQTLAASGGVLPYTWSLVSGSLPPGLTLNKTNGTISGTPTGGLGVSTFAVQVTDSSPPPALTVQKAFTINIALTLTITTQSLPNGAVGAAYPSTQILASGGTTPYTWSVTSGSLPPGLQLNTTSGTITGTPTASGTNLFTVVVTDASGATASVQLTIAVQGPLTITTTTPAPATVGVAFTDTLSAAGGTPPYTWSISNGTLPAGLSLANGVISGTPTASGNFTVTLSVTDSKSLTATAPLTINVSAGTPPALPAVTIGAITGTPATQPKVSLSLASAYTTDLTGTLSVSFQSAVGGNPTEVQFITSSGGSSSVNFLIPAGQTNATFTGSPVLATGTVAGTITLTATFASGSTNVTPSPAPTETISIASSAPVIESVQFSNSGGTISVSVIGYSTTREMQSGVFTFAPAVGSTLSQSAITVQLGSAFAAWYSSSASNQYGGQFMLTAPFTASANGANVIGVSVTLTNTKGTSAAASPN